jgi:hypothetical protein
MSPRDWPGLLIAAITITWLVLVVAYWWWRLRCLMQKQTDGVGPVSGSLVEFTLILMGPPALLVAAWLLLRRQG